jgi:membrane protein implicated in regulation of membrane protease activity
LQIWVIVAVVGLLIDIVLGNVLFVTFTFGGICAIVANLLHANQLLQVIVFILTSGLFLATAYPLIRKTLKKTVPKTQTMEESYIGRKIILDKDVVEKATMKIDGIYWTVKNHSEGPLKKGERIEIIGIEGNKLLIKRSGGD